MIKRRLGGSYNHSRLLAENVPVKDSKMLKFQTARLRQAFTHGREKAKLKTTRGGSTHFDIQPRDLQVWVLRGRGKKKRPLAIVCTPHKSGSSTLEKWIFSGVAAAPITNAHGLGHDWLASHGIERWDKTGQITRASLLHDPSVWRYAIVRDPLQRFLSGFRSKLDCAKENAEPVVKRWSRDVIGVECFDSPNEFAWALVRLPYSRVNSHFLPQVQACGRLSYDREFQFENMANFSESLGPKLGIRTFVRFRDHEYDVPHYLNQSTIRLLLKFYSEDIMWRERLRYTSQLA